MDIMTGAMGALPAKVLQLLKDEYDLQAGVKEDVQLLSKELEVMHAALSKVAQVPPEKLDAQAKLWARDFREASYDIEDILDSFLVRVHGDPQHAYPDMDRRRRRRLLSKIAELICMGKVTARHDIATAIRRFRKQLNETDERHKRYRVPDHLVRAIPAATSIDPRIEALYKKASDLIGIDEPRDTLIKMLSIGAGEDDDPTYRNKLKVVSIFGSGGLGKTTIAKAAYDRVKLEFDCCAFVQVGQHPDPKKVLKDILVKLIVDQRKRAANGQDDGLYTGADLIGLEAEDLIGHLREFLGAKRYFIVADDIWDSGTWENIKLAFVDSDNGSRVVTTSRNYQVSARIGNQVFRINKLSDDNSRKLFYARISGKKGDKGDDTDNISNKVIRKCHGVPLAIIAVASALATKPRNEWPDAYKSIGFGHEDNTEANNMKKILLFSYYDLPCHLRACMLYLSVFPEDYYVDKNMLIWRWIAEGLVHSENGKGPFEVGDGYFHELINRGLLLEEEVECVLMGCRVHDFVVALIRELASEENFVAILDSEEPSLSLPRGKVRRLALQDQWDKKQSWTVEVDEICIPEARSFHAIVCQSHLIPPVAAFKFLRLLSLQRCLPKEGYLEHIGKLLHLRYLGLSYTPVKMLPEEVGNLKFLQTLQLHGSGIEALPESLQQCKGLMCLRTDTKTRVPDWIGELTSLVELEIFPGAAGECFAKELGRLTNLRWLRTYIDLQDKAQARDLLKSLSKLENIEVLNVYSTSYRIFVLRTEEDMKLPDLFRGFKNLRIFPLRVVMFQRMPAWVTRNNFPIINHLEINLGDVRQEDMEILGSFPRLQYLDLHTSNYIYGKVHVADTGFQSLVTFVSPWPCITFEKGAMPRLEHIYIDINVAMATEENRVVLDFGLENLCSLQRVTVKMNCKFCFPEEVEIVEAAIRHQVGIHPNHQTMQVIKYSEDIMATTESGLLQRILLREELVAGRVMELVRLFNQWYKSTDDDSDCVVDAAMHKRVLFRDLTYDIIQHVFFGRILWRGEIDEEGHRDYDQERARFNEQVGAKYQQLISLQPDRDISQVAENIAALEKVHEGLIVEIPRMVSMWEELKAEMSQQAPLQEEDAGTDHDSPRVSDASPVLGEGQDVQTH